MKDFWVDFAEQEVGRYSGGKRASVAAKTKGLLKFGKNETLGTSRDTIWNVGGNETYCTDNLITHVSSSSALDTGLMYVEGHTVSGTGASAEFTFVSQTVTLAGQTR